MLQQTPDKTIRKKQKCMHKKEKLSKPMINMSLNIINVLDYIPSQIKKYINIKYINTE